MKKLQAKNWTWSSVSDPEAQELEITMMMASGDSGHASSKQRVPSSVRSGVGAANAYKKVLTISESISISESSNGSFCPLRGSNPRLPK
jgi:hypothetical protein